MASDDRRVKYFKVGSTKHPETGVEAIHVMTMRPAYSDDYGNYQIAEVNFDEPLELVGKATENFKASLKLMTRDEQSRIRAFAQIMLSAEGVPNVAVRADGSIWRREAFRDVGHSLATSLAGPVADLMSTQALNPFSDKVDGKVLSAVLAYLRADQDGGTASDSSRVLIYSTGRIYDALSAATSAASRAHADVLIRPVAHDALWNLVARLEPAQCVVIDQLALLCLRGQQPKLRLEVVDFRRWYNAVTVAEDARRTQEMHDEMLLINAQMMRFGQLDARGYITPDGIARLGLNETLQ